MKYLPLAVLSAILLIFAVGCRKDEIITDTITNPPPPIVVEFTDSEIYGQVIDGQGNLISDAQVTWGTENVQTDENGFFTLNSTVKKHNAVLKVEKDGYFSALKTLQTIENVKAKAIIQLVERVLSGTLQTDTGGTINTNEQGSITFAANSFIDANGDAYNGSVNVFAYYLDPTIEDLKEIMPGNLTAINAENTPQLLTSYGMMNVELEDDAGNSLQLSANATLTTPVPTTLQGQAPESIPLWYFDTTEGTWREEGSANLQGDVYVGEVAHFTWWNCDVPSNFIYLEGQIDGGVEGTPILTIKITEISSGQSGVMDTYDKGNFAGSVPKDQALLLEIFSSCGDLLYSDEIGPFSEDTEMATIPVDLSSLNWLSFSGTLIDCNDNPVSNGYLILNAINSSMNEVLIPDAQGFVSVSFAECATEEVTYFGIDLESFETGNDNTVTLTENTQVGNISACGNEITESFELTIAGETMTWLPCTAELSSGIDGDLTIHISTSHVQDNGSVNYDFYYIDWNGDPSNPLWAMSYEWEIIGSPEVFYNFNLGFSGAVELEILSNGELSGSLLHMFHSNLIVEDTNNSISEEGCSIEIKATIQ